MNQTKPKKSRVDSIRLFILLTAIPSVILPWAIIEIVFDQTSTKYIYYFFFGLLVLFSPAINELFAVSSIMAIMAYSTEYTIPFFNESLVPPTSYFLMIPGAIYIAGIILSLKNKREITGDYKHKKYGGIGFTLIMVSFVLYYYILFYMVAGYIYANPHHINSGRLRDINIYPSIGGWIADISGTLVLVKFIISIWKNKKIKKLYGDAPPEVVERPPPQFEPYQNTQVLRLFKLGGLLLILTMFIPTVYIIGSSWYDYLIWSWFFVILYSNRGNQVLLGFLNMGLLLGLILLGVGIYIIHKSNKLKTGYTQIEVIKKKCLFCSIMGILIPILYIIFLFYGYRMRIPFSYSNIRYHIIVVFFPIGILVSFIGSILILYGIKKSEEIISP